jgi:curved DNA-binding protein CbpA
MSFEKKTDRNKELSDDSLDAIVNKIANGSKKKEKLNEDKQKYTKSDSDDIEYDDVDFSELDQNTKKIYTDLFSGMPDIYKIVGVSPDDDQNTIKKKCNEKLAKYHPDKIGPLLNKCAPEVRPKEKKRLSMQYKLIREAYSILRDPHKKKFYDLQKKTVDSKNFAKQKSSFEEFIKLQESEITEHSKDSAQNDFKMKVLEMDKRTGFDRKKLDDVPLSKADIDKRMQDLMIERENQDIEYVPKNLFEGRDFNPSTFHKEWEKQKRKDEKRLKNSNNDRSIVTWEGVSAANDIGIDGSTDYISATGDYGDLYIDNKKGSLFAQKLDSGSDSEGEYSESSDDIDVSYVTGHNSNKGSVMDKFKEYEQSRKLEDDSYENRGFNDETTWKSVMDNPMNISSQMNTMIGKDIKQLDGFKKKKHIDKDYAEAYKQLIYNDSDKKSKK